MSRELVVSLEAAHGFKICEWVMPDCITMQTWTNFQTEVLESKVVGFWWQIRLVFHYREKVPANVPRHEDRTARPVQQDRTQLAEVRALHPEPDTGPEQDA